MARKATSSINTPASGKQRTTPSRASESKAGRSEADKEEERREKEVKGEPKKQRKAAKKRDEEDMGGKDFFSSIPFDVLYLICTSLRPRDVLALSRTNKRLRATLLAKGASSAWSAARRSVGMPDLEADDVSEPKYCYLVYGKVCQVCRRLTYPTELEHHVRARCCQPCFNKNLRTKASLRKKCKQLNKATFDCALETKFSAAGNTRTDAKSYYFVPEVIAISTHLDSLKVAPLVPQLDNNGLPDGKLIDAASAYIAERRELKKKVKVDAKAIYKFQVATLDDALEMERERMEARKKQIYERLADAGYEEVDCKGLQWEVRTAFNSTKRLTATGKSPSLPSLLSLFAEFLHRAEWRTFGRELENKAARNNRHRLARERDARQTRQKQLLCPLHAQLLSTFAPSSTEYKTFPSYDQWIRLPSVDKLWEPDDAVEVEPSGGDALKPAILADVAASARKRKLVLFDNLARALKDDSVALSPRVLAAVNSYPPAPPYGFDPSTLYAHLDDEAELDPLFARADALFTCGCGERRPFPDVVEHVAGAHGSGTYPHASWGGYGAAGGGGGGAEVVAKEFRAKVREMLDEAGLAEGTTHEELRGLGAIFEVECLEAGKGTAERSGGLTWDEVNTKTAQHQNLWGTWTTTVAFRTADVAEIRIVPPAPPKDPAATEGEKQASTSAST
ncbi:hypothetical protein JCM8097_000259 [Rhodosporidiobolus ruineniae]